MSKKIPSGPLVIRPPDRENWFNLRELASYRYLLWSMAWKSIRLEFDQLALGYFWAVARPIAMVLIFTFIKNRSGANLHVEISYPLYLYSGIVLWFYFRDATMAAAKSVLKDAGMIKRVYYPRMITPMAPVLSHYYSLSIAFLPMIVLMIGYSTYPGWRLALLPLVLLQCSMLVLGLGLIFACLIIVKADFEKLLNLCLYLGLFVSPVIFAPEMIPERFRVIYFINPMAGTLLAFRSCLFQQHPFPLGQFAYSAALTALLLFIGARIYRRAESYLADHL